MGHAEIGGGQLRIEQRHRQAAGEAQEHLEVFAAGMQHLHHPLVFEQLGEGAPVLDQQRIDQPLLPAIAHLHQTGRRIEGIDAHELGIEREVRLCAPFPALLRQAGIIADPLDFGRGHEHLLGQVRRII